MQILFEDFKVDPVYSVLLSISLPLKWKDWPQCESNYYQTIIEKVKAAFKELI